MSSNPKYIGPGYWASWHLKTLKTDTREKKAEVSRSIVVDISNFPCLECREDSINYVKNFPLINAVKSKDPLSLFKWTVDFHNHVNLKLGKSVLNWREASEAWQEENICFENCGVPDEKITEKESDVVEFVIRSY